jgi:hypothetical protein
MTHTPGPWRIEGHRKYPKGTIVEWTVSFGFSPAGDGPEGYVGYVNASKEDARLMAAAPDLLEALKKLEEASDDSDDCQYGTLSTSFVRDIARAAIAKAEDGL